MASRVIDAVLRLTDDFTKPLQRSIEAMTNCSKSAVRIGRDIEKTGQKISSIGMAATAAVTMPLVGIGAASVKEFGEVDKNLRLIQQTMGSSQEEAEMLEKSIKKAAKHSVFGMTDATMATLNYARAGFNAAEASALIEPALSLAAGTATDLSLTTTGLGGVMKAFNLDMSNASHVADVFAKSQAQANITASELIDVIGIGAPMFKTVGWGFEDMATAADIFGDAVIPVNEGMTAMKTGLMRLANPKETGIEAVDRATQALFDENGQMKSFVETQGILHDAFANLSQHQKLLAADTLFGKNQAAKWIALIDAAPETVNKYRDALDDCSDAAKNMADALMAGTGGALETLASTFDVAKYDIGKIVGEVIQPFIVGLTNLINAFTEMDHEQQKQVVRWGMMAAAVGPAVMAFGKVVSAVGVGVQIFNKIGLAVKAAGSGIAVLALPASVVIGVVAALAAIILVVVTHLDQFKAALKKVETACAPAAKGLMSAFQSLYNAVAPIIKFIMDLVANVLVNAFEKASTGITMAIDAVTQIINGFATIFRGVVNIIGGIVNLDWKRVVTGFGEIFTGQCDIIAGRVEAIISLFTSVVGAVGGAIAGVGKFVVESVEGARQIEAVGSGTKTARGIGRNAAGTKNWRGGPTYINERGGEIIDLPKGSRVYPHDESIAMARREGMNASNGTPAVVISGNTFNVRSDADIEAIGEAIVRKLKGARDNRGGWSFNGAMA